MSDVDNGADELDLDEAGRLAYAAVVRRLKNDETTPIGATALARFAQWHMDLTEERRRREEAARPKPEENAAQANDFLASLRQMHEDGRITTSRMAEIVKGYVLLCDEHLELARAFERELAAEVVA
jgi:hypothetical protein